MSATEDPRTSDEATGLPPLEEVEAESSLVVTTWAGGSGIVAHPGIGEPVAVRWLHVRGLINNDDGNGVQWGQLHIAVPVEHAVDVAATLAAGGVLDATPQVVRVVRLRYPTPGFPLPYGECTLRTIRLGNGDRVAVVTEIPDNPGASVTNAAEHITKALEGHGHAALIEHYPPKSHRHATLDEVIVKDGRVSWRPIKGELRDTLLALLDGG